MNLENIIISPLCTYMCQEEISDLTPRGEDENIASFHFFYIFEFVSALEHSVYRKPTHIDRYLHALSYDHPTQKQYNSCIERFLFFELNNFKIS